MHLGLHLALTSPAASSAVLFGDSTPGGSTDVWMWETGIGVQWETEIFMLTE